METINYKGYTLKIQQDQDAENPNEWGNTDIFLTGYHTRNFWVERKGFELEKVQAHIEDNPANTPYRGYHVLPLYAYIHSGVSLSTSNKGYPFNDRFDSDIVGYIFVSVPEWPDKGKAYEAAQSLVNEWNMYLSGDVYGYLIEDKNGDIVDSCCGFYGKKYCIEEAKSMVDYYCQESVKKHLNQVKTWIRNRVPFIYRKPLNYAI